MHLYLFLFIHSKLLFIHWFKTNFMWDLIRDSIILIVGIVISIVQSVQGKTIKSKTLWWFVALILIALGVNQIISNTSEKEKEKIVMNDLKKNIEDLINQKRADSLERISNDVRDSIFEARLFNEFKISRDSINNRPVRYIYNTHIRNADKVNIGR